VQPPDGRIAGDHDVRAISESLQAPIPDISVDVIVGTWSRPKIGNVPQRGQGKPNYENVPRKLRG
jgi:hypothetical protein